MSTTFSDLLEKYIGEGVCCFDDLTPMEAQHLTAALIRERDLLKQWAFIKVLNANDCLVDLLVDSLDFKLTADLHGISAHLQAMLQQSVLDWGQPVIAEAIAKALADDDSYEEV